MTQFEPVAGGVDRWVMPEAAMNAVVIADRGEALVIDPGTLPSRAAELRDAIVARGDRLVGVVITHAHWDHCFALGAMGGVPAYAHPAAVEELREHGESQRQEVLELAGPQTAGPLRELTIVLPDHPVPERRTVRVGTIDVELEPIGRAHTAGDLVVHVPAAGVTITGDLVETAEEPQLTETGDVAGWLAALDLLAARAERLLVPGHGEPCGHERLDHHRALFTRAAAEQG